MQVNHCDSPCKIFLFFFQIKIKGKELKKKVPCNKMEALCMVLISELLQTAKYIGASEHKILLSVR